MAGSFTPQGLRFCAVGTCRLTNYMPTECPNLYARSGILHIHASSLTLVSVRFFVGICVSISLGVRVVFVVLKYPHIGGSDVLQRPRRLRDQTVRGRCRGANPEVESQASLLEDAGVQPFLGMYIRDLTLTHTLCAHTYIYIHVVICFICYLAFSTHIPFYTMMCMYRSCYLGACICMRILIRT